MTVTFSAPSTAMSTKDERFFKDLGARIAARAGGKRGPAPRLQQQLERLSALPKLKQRAVMEVLESMLAQAAREEART